ncbi:hypothetical protein ACPCA8_19710 [Streptomyces capoamus]|uniref:hypothetical protein n=1 Tax=Streptomyces capoamus TaxID=68183 RepID=UPI003C2DF528
MNRTARVGALIGAVAMSVGLGVTSGTPAAAQGRVEVAATASPVTKFFEPSVKMPGNLSKPGAKLIIKRNADYARSPSTFKSPSRRDLGEACNTEVIGKTSGSGKTTLVLTISKERAVKLSGDANIGKGIISVAVGFSVTDTYKVSNETRYEVPKGKHGTVEAYTLMHHYQVSVPVRLGSSIYVPVDVYKPVGVCFNEWLD